VWEELIHLANASEVGDRFEFMGFQDTIIAKKIAQLNSASEERRKLKKQAIMWASKHTWERSGEAFRELCFNLRTS